MAMPAPATDENNVWYSVNIGSVHWVTLSVRCRPGAAFAARSRACLSCTRILADPLPPAPP